MAGDQEIAVKVSINPFQELDEKKLALMTTKEVGLKEVKKANYTDFKAKFTVTTVKWNQRKLEAQARAIFRYDLALFAAKVWQAFGPYQKAKKNGKNTFKEVIAFRAKVIKLKKKLEQNLNDRFEEFQEEIASGASDDAGELKNTRKGLDPGNASDIAGYSSELFEKFWSEYDALKKLKDAETKASGEDKAKATQELDKALVKSLSDLGKANDAASKGMEKSLKAIQAMPPAMLKSIKKEMSDSAKDEYKKSAAELSKALKPMEKNVSAAQKNSPVAIAKMKQKNLSKSTIDLAVAALHKISSCSGELSTTLKKIDGKLKKLEQAAKKR